MFEDLRWLGIHWTEDPDCGGADPSYSQSQRREFYLAWKQLRAGEFIYPCTCSRKELAQSASGPNDLDDQPIYPGTCRRRTDGLSFEEPAGVNWRFRVPDDDETAFHDLYLGPQGYVAGRDFGDFVIWRRDDVPAYQLAVVADDDAMRITEVVRGADLLKSTARQLRLYRALGLDAPSSTTAIWCAMRRSTSGKAARSAQHPEIAAGWAGCGKGAAKGDELMYVTGYIRYSGVVLVLVLTVGNRRDVYR